MERSAERAEFFAEYQKIGSQRAIIAIGAVLSMLTALRYFPNEYFILTTFYLSSFFYIVPILGSLEVRSLAQSEKLNEMKISAFLDANEKISPEHYTNRGIPYGYRLKEIASLLLDRLPAPVLTVILFPLLFAGVSLYEEYKPTGTFRNFYEEIEKPLGRSFFFNCRIFHNFFLLCFWCCGNAKDVWRL